MKRVYLIGGLGNNLFQLNAAKILSAKSDKEVVIVTNIVESRFLHNLFRWTFHDFVLTDVLTENKLRIERVPIPVICWDLSNLFIHKSFPRLKTNVVWDSEDERATAYFGYFQTVEQWAVRCEIMHFSASDINVPLIHMRLGDSPTLKEDVVAQIDLIRSLGITAVKVVTNDRVSAERLLKHSRMDVLYKGGSVVEDFKEIANTKCVIIPNSTFSLTSILSSNLIETVYLRTSMNRFVELLKSRGLKVISY